MSKGSKRRPAQVTDEQVADNWERTFRKGRIAMGYMRHHAIVVTSSDNDQLELARDAAADAGLSPSAIVSSAVNLYHSFFVPPDGSKEGWEESDVGDASRDCFVNYLRPQSGFLSWVEVFYGDDNRECEVVRHGDRR